MSPQTGGTQLAQEACGREECATARQRDLEGLEKGAGTLFIEYKFHCG